MIKIICNKGIKTKKNENNALNLNTGIFKNMLTLG